MKKRINHQVTVGRYTLLVFYQEESTMSSSTSGSTVEQGNYAPWGRWKNCGSGSGEGRARGHRAQWSGFNIAAMVLGFVFFWPIGLIVLGWILSGRHVQELPGAVRQLWFTVFDKRGNSSGSGNCVFHDYQQTQYDRIREIKEEIKARSHRFSEFRSDAKRRADQEEFDRFMASSPSSGTVSRDDQ